MLVFAVQERVQARQDAAATWQLLALSGRLGRRLQLAPLCCVPFVQGRGALPQACLLAQALRDLPAPRLQPAAVLRAGPCGLSLGLQSRPVQLLSPHT